MIEEFYIKKNDLQPDYYAQVKDGDGTVVDITSATIRCSMKNARSDALKIDRQDTGINISDGTNGEFEYQWQSGDTDTSGKYYIEFEVTPTAGGKFTVPASYEDRAVVIVLESLDAS